MSGKEDDKTTGTKSAVPDEETLENMDAAEWAELLAEHPELAEKCDWTQFSLHEVAGILHRQPAAARSAISSASPAQAIPPMPITGRETA